MLFGAALAACGGRSPAMDLPGEHETFGLD
jgi:hypothetical protein